MAHRFVAEEAERPADSRARESLRIALCTLVRGADECNRCHCEARGRNVNQAKKQKKKRTTHDFHERIGSLAGSRT